MRFGFRYKDKKTCFCLNSVSSSSLRPNFSKILEDDPHENNGLFDLLSALSLFIQTDGICIRYGAKHTFWQIHQHIKNRNEFIFVLGLIICSLFIWLGFYAVLKNSTGGRKTCGARHPHIGCWKTFPHTAGGEAGVSCMLKLTAALFWVIALCQHTDQLNKGHPTP